MIPEGWKRVSLETVADVRSGVAKGKSGLKDPITVPYLRVANVQDGHINLNEVKSLEIERHQLERYSLMLGDVLMNEGGDFDKLGRGDVWLGQVSPCLHQNHVFAVRPNQSKMDSFFLAAIAASNYGKTYFLSCAKRSTNLASINSTQIKEFPVILPPLPEQKKIAKILSTWDKAITTTKQLLANSQQQKKALMQQLLTGRKRLKGFEGKWKNYTLAELGNTFTGLSGKTKDDFGKGKAYIPYINIFKNSKIDITAMDFVTINDGENQSDVQYGDIFFTTSSETPEEVGMSSVLLDHVENIYLNSFCFGFRLYTFDRLLPDYARYLFRSSEVRAQISVLGQGATRYNLSKKQLMKIEIPLPTIDEQQKIAAVLSTTDREVDVLQQKLEGLKQEKKAMMQQLLTGKRRVSIN